MINNTWNWNDTLTTDEYGYWVTSGDYDGSTSTDENDADVHFWVWDTYVLPVADAGNDKTVEINTYVNFSGSNSWSAVPDTRIVSYEWDFDGDGHYDAVGKNVSWKFTQLGTYIVTLKVTDNMGNSDTDTCTVKVVDTKPPTITITTPNDGSLFNTHSITIKYQGSDSGSGIDHYEIQVDSGSWNNVGTSTSYTILSLTDGSHTVYVKAVDKAGNTAEDSVNFTVDTTLPTLNIISPTNGTTSKSEKVILHWNASDLISGINHYEISVDNHKWINIGNNTTYTLKLSNGEHIVKIKAVDNAGNEIIESIHLKVSKMWFWLMILLIAISIIVIVIVIYMIKRRKEGDVNEP